MTNNLRKISQELRTFAKRTKDFKYTDSALIIFLMTGMIFTASNVFAANEDSSIRNQVTQINTSINQIRTDFKRARKENNKLVKDTTLELIQLTEQGDHVTKAPFSSWQYGINYFNNNWNGTYKGRGDKSQKYPYEGIFTRYGSNVLGSKERILRYIKPENLDYYNRAAIPQGISKTSASSTNRLKSDGYGLASNSPVTTTVAQIELDASITPRTIQKASPLSAPQGTNLLIPDFNPPVITPPNISMNPITISVNVPTITIPSVNPPTINAPSTGNGDEAYIAGTSGYLVDDQSYYPYNSNVAPISQQNMTNGTMDVNVTGDSAFTIQTNGIKFQGEYNNHQLGTVYTSNLNETYNNYGQYAAMKLVGGQQIDINNVNINFTGNPGSNNYQKWLFHTDGHNDYGESTWVLGSGTNVNVTGSKLVMYTSQYHSGTPQHANIGFVNEGTISFGGNDNIGWVALDEWGDTTRQLYFHNKGTVNFGGNNNIIAYINF